MKTTRNIKKAFAIILAMLMCMSITATAFAVELRQSATFTQEISETNEQVAPQASHSMRFTYPATKEVYFSTNFKYMEYEIIGKGAGNVTFTFTGQKGATDRKFTVSDSSGRLTVNIEGHYEVSVSNNKEVNFYFWS